MYSSSITSLQYFHSQNASRFSVLLLLWISALIDLPQNLIIGGITLSSALTIGMVCVSGLLIFIRPEIPKLGLFRYFIIMAFCGGTSFLWGSVDLKQGIQNYSILILFISCMFIATRESFISQNLYDKIIETIYKLAIPTLIIYILISAMENGKQIMFPRAFALYALIVLSIYLAKSRNGHKFSFFMALVVIGTIGYSLSRTALAVAIILLLLSRIKLNFRGIFSFLLIGTIAFSGFYLAIKNIPQLNERFFMGDMKFEVAGIPINAMGRAELWNSTLNSYKEYLIFGQGVGSSEKLLRSGGFVTTHPHNDYLRILHDYGAIGLLLWIVGFIKLLNVTWRNWHKSEKIGIPSTIHVAAFLLLVALSLMMFTDNPMVCGFFMAPLGIVVGTSMGLGRNVSNEKFTS